MLIAVAHSSLAGAALQRVMGRGGRAVYVLYVVDLSGLGVGHLPAVGQRSERVLLRRMKVGVRLLGAVRD